MTPLRGIVHDPTARRMGGVAGHAGLFSTAADLATFCRMILGGGAYRGVRILSPLAVARMTSRATPAEERNTRGLGWDIDSSFSSNRGELLPIGSFGHTGFTGTSLWLDPASGMFVVFLSNRVHPDGKGDVTQLRGRVATVAAAALMPVLPVARETSTGADFGPSGSLPASTSAVRPTLAGSTCFVPTDLRCSRETHRSGDQPYRTRPGRRDDHRSSAQFLGRERDIRWWHCSAPSMAFAACSKQTCRRRGTRKLDYRSIRSTATHGGRPTPCCKASTRWSSTCRTSARASTHT